MPKAKIIVFVLCTMPILLSCQKKSAEQEEIIRPVRYVQTFATGGTRVRTFSGVAQAGVESRLSFKVGGTVKSVAVMLGDQVKARQLIAELDPSDYQLQSQQADAALTQALAQSRNASSTYERIRALYENNNAALSQLEEARTAYETTKAAVLAAEKQLELAKLRLSYCRLRAPVNGAIASVDVESSENIQPGQPAVTLTSGSQIEVKISVPEMLISKIREGEGVTVVFDAISEKEFSATILEVGSSASSAGTAFPVTVRLTGSDPSFRPGMAATVACSFGSADERERFIVPSHAVMEDPKGRFVYTVEPLPDDSDFGTVNRKLVKTGDMTADGIEIFDGISDGDLVITAGMSRIKDGLKVKLR